MWFDEVFNLLGNRIRVVLASPKDQRFPFSIRLEFNCTNNMTEYEAYAIRILMALEHQVKKLKVFGDSTLVIYQLGGEWEMYLEKGEYPERVSVNDKRTLRRLTFGFFLSGTILYKRSADMMLLQCVDGQEAKEIMEEVNKGTFDMHTNGHALT
ncbi:hypothetical protein CR513_11192, partial [Mucuna pruriens]